MPGALARRSFPTPGGPGRVRFSPCGRTPGRPDSGRFAGALESGTKSRIHPGSAGRGSGPLSGAAAFGWLPARRSPPGPGRVEASRYEGSSARATSLMASRVSRVCQSFKFCSRVSRPATPVVRIIGSPPASRSSSKSPFSICASRFGGKGRRFGAGSSSGRLSGAASIALQNTFQAAVAKNPKRRRPAHGWRRGSKPRLNGDDLFRLVPQAPHPAPAKREHKRQKSL